MLLFLYLHNVYTLPIDTAGKYTEAIQVTVQSIVQLDNGTISVILPLYSMEIKQ